MDQRTIAHRLCRVIYEDDQYLFLNKAAGAGSLPPGRDRGASVFDLLAERDDAARLLPIYDLGPWQSGVLGYAKSEAAQRHLLTGLETGSARATYLAVVQGRLPARSPLTRGLKGPLTISAGLKQIGPDRYAVDRRARGPEAPVTHVEPIERGEMGALVRCRPGLLNHHQVRAHLESVKLRVLGDAVYRPKPRGGQIGPLMLHLEELRFHHPGLKRALGVRAVPPAYFAAAVDREGRRGGLGGLLAARLHAALAARLPCWLDDGTDAFRVLGGRADAVSGLVADLYGDVLILQVRQGQFDPTGAPLRDIARWYRKQLGVTAVYVKHFVKDRSFGGPGPDELRDPKPLAGNPAAERFTIRENGLNFWVRAYDGYSVGLFLDHRANRRRIRELAAGRSVLNLFCYTCGFSVAAAAGGAAGTVNVDLSRKSLEWGKENFTANGFALDHHQFINDDAFNYFKRAGRQGRKFDMLIVDPPSFARSKQGRRAFTLERDLHELLAGAVSFLNPNGVILVATNHRPTTRRWLGEQIVAAAGSRKVSPVSTPPLPIDFVGSPDHAKTVIARIR